jgi:hypothetical protein
MGFLAGGPQSANVSRLTVEGAATAGQTIIPIPGGCTPGMTDVYVGGAVLSQSDYDDSSGSQIVLTKQMALGTQFRVVAYNAVVTINIATPAAPISTLVTPVLGATGIAISYTPGFVLLYRNGSKLPPTDYTATDGKNIVFTGFTGDGVTQYEVQSWASIAPANCLSSSNPIITGPQLTFADGSQMASSPIGRKNWLQNGAFSIWQRATSFTNPTNTSNMYVADRWGCFRAGYATGMTIAKIAAGGARSNSAVQITRTPGDTNTQAMFISTSLETIDVLQLAGKQMTLSYDVYGSGGFVGANFGLTVASGTGTDGNMGQGFTGYSAIATKATTLINGWQRVSVTFTIPTGVTQFGISGGVTPSGTAGAADWFAFTAAQLELGSVATPFELTNYADYLQRCQRFYEQLGGAGQYDILVQGYNLTGGAVSIVIPYKVTKRTPIIPTRVGTWFVQNCSQPAVVGIASAQHAVMNGAATASGVMQYNTIDATTYLIANAEL